MIHASLLQKLNLSIQTNALSIQDSSAMMQVDQKEMSIVAVDGMQNGGNLQADFILYHSKRLEDDLKILGQKIKQHEDNIKALKTQRNKLDDSILDLQVILGKYHSSSAPEIENEASNLQSEEETTGQILQHEKTAAGVFCQLKTRHGTQASHLSLAKDVLGVVASLGQVEDENLSRLFSEYLGVDTMLAIVCKTFEGVQALETYDKEGCIIKSAGLHGLGASIGRAIDGRFLVVCLENLSDGAISLDGGMIRSPGIFSLGSRQNVDVRFPKASGTLNKPDNYAATERQIQEMKWRKEKLQEDAKIENALLYTAKASFDRKKQEFVKFLAESSTYASQMQTAQQGLTPR